MNKPTMISGRVWVLRDSDGRPLDDIDTDMIYHNAHLAITDLREMGQYAFGNLEGWQDFPSRVGTGDILIAGGNFGSGSSRQQAVDCFVSLGVSLLIAESFGAIYRRNAINSGFPIIACPGILHESKGQLVSGETVEVDLETGEIRKGEEAVARARPFSEVQMGIYQAGDLFSYARSHEV
ncbi:MAG: 3-isopropylmalate dehydratase [Candidatus Eisenbacteria sp.]|nr:3-isopropylmalate dehydratase [Candidatus Eisenbacteria bacterium]